MERKQFTFYESFFKAISRIKDDSARCEAYDAICAYALSGEEPDLENLSDAAAIAFELAKPNLDASRKKAKGGSKGRKTEDTAKTEVRCTEDSGNKKEGEEEIEKEKEEEDECPKKSIKKSSPKKETPPPVVADYSGTTFSPDMVAKVDAWLRYKQERREGYKPTGLKSLITEIQNNVKRYGESAVMEVITKSMAANYKGIVFDWLQNGTVKPQAPQSGGDRLLEMIRRGDFDE